MSHDNNIGLLIDADNSSAADDNGRAHLGAVGSHINKQASFDQRNYGFAKPGDLFAEIDLFTTEKREKGLYVRDNRKPTDPLA